MKNVIVVIGAESIGLFFPCNKHYSQNILNSFDTSTGESTWTISYKKTAVQLQLTEGSGEGEINEKSVNLAMAAWKYPPSDLAAWE